MKLGEKIRYLREVEGSLRGLNRAMNQQELVRAIKAETGSKMSQSYISQIESGARPHLTNTTRQILAGFFKVHPGYLVDDPEGYHPELMSELRQVEDKLDLWLVNGAERFRRDPELMSALLVLARHECTRECLLMLEAIIETPGLMPRLIEVLRPSFATRPLKANNGPLKVNGGASRGESALGKSTGSASLGGYARSSGRRASAGEDARTTAGQEAGATSRVAATTAVRETGATSRVAATTAVRETGATSRVAATTAVRETGATSKANFRAGINPRARKRVRK
jgi:transcriptional regulator with XRE-family HTH domain